MDKKIRLLFLGAVVDKATVHKYSGSSVAGNNMQSSLLKALVKEANVSLDAISIYPIAPFPIEKIIHSKKVFEMLMGNIRCEYIPFINIPIIKQFHQTISIYIAAKKILQNDKNVTILTYNAFPPWGIPAMRLKKKYGVKVVALLADLPIDVSDKGLIGRSLRRLYYRLTILLIKGYDKLIVLNKNAIDEYAPHTPFLLVEGGIEKNEFEGSSSQKNYSDKGTEKIILFAGTLNKYNGIKELILAMTHVKRPDACLHIYGQGPMSEYVINAASKNNRIKFLGYISNDEIKERQKEASLLISTRPPNDSVSRVTFPSKILEYMMSGVPVMTTKLNGISEDLAKYLLFIPDNTPIAIANAIDSFFDNQFSINDSFGTLAKNYVVKNMNWDVQCKKILEFIQ